MAQESQVHYVPPLQLNPSCHGSPRVTFTHHRQDPQSYYAECYCSEHAPCRLGGRRHRAHAPCPPMRHSRHRKYPRRCCADRMQLRAARAWEQDPPCLWTSGHHARKPGKSAPRRRSLPAAAASTRNGHAGGFFFLALSRCPGQRGNAVILRFCSGSPQSYNCML